MKVAIYHMVNNPTRESCITLQLDILKKYAKEQSWEIYDVYLDKTNVFEDKLELNRLIEDSHKHCFDILLMKNAYYISRNTPTFVSIRNDLKKHGVELYTLCEGFC